jgi:hypothetical protein
MRLVGGGAVLLRHLPEQARLQRQKPFRRRDGFTSNETPHSGQLVVTLGILYCITKYAGVRGPAVGGTGERERAAVNIWGIPVVDSGRETKAEDIPTLGPPLLPLRGDARVTPLTAAELAERYLCEGCLGLATHRGQWVEPNPQFDAEAYFCRGCWGKFYREVLCEG